MLRSALRWIRKAKAVNMSPVVFHERFQELYKLGAQEMGISTEFGVIFNQLIFDFPDRFDQNITYEKLLKQLFILAGDGAIDQAQEAIELLCDAIGRNDNEEVAQLLKCNSKLAARINHDGFSPLHYAVFGNNHYITQMLVNAHADINAISSEGIMPIMLVQGANEKVTTQRGKTQYTHRIARLLHARGSNVNQVNPQGRYPLCFAATFSDKFLEINRAVAHKLLAEGAQIDLAGPCNSTALMWAVKRAKPELVRLFIQAGANYKIRSDKSETLPMLAARAFDAATFKALCEEISEKHGKVVTSNLLNAHDDQGYAVLTLLDLAQQQDKGNNHSVEIAPMWHDFSNHCKTDINMVDSDGRTALMAACASGQPEAVEILIKYNANVECIGKENKTAYALAVGAKEIFRDRAPAYEHIIKLLNDEGADGFEQSLVAEKEAKRVADLQAAKAVKEKARQEIAQRAQEEAAQALKDAADKDRAEKDKADRQKKAKADKAKKQRADRAERSKLRKEKDSAQFTVSSTKDEQKLQKVSTHDAEQKPSVRAAQKAAQQMKAASIERFRSKWQQRRVKRHMEEFFKQLKKDANEATLKKFEQEAQKDEEARRAQLRLQQEAQERARKEQERLEEQRDKEKARQAQADAFKKSLARQQRQPSAGNSGKVVELGHVGVKADGVLMSKEKAFQEQTAFKNSVAAQQKESYADNTGKAVELNHDSVKTEDVLKLTSGEEVPSLRQIYNEHKKANYLDWSMMLLENGTWGPLYLEQEEKSWQLKVSNTSLASWFCVHRASHDARITRCANYECPVCESIGLSNVRNVHRKVEEDFKNSIEHSS